MKFPILRIVFWITCIAFAVVMIGVLFGALSGMIGGRDRALSPELIAVLSPAMTVWLSGAGILWVYSFVVIGRRWTERADSRNYMLLFVLLFFGIIASPYIYWKRESI